MVERLVNYLKESRQELKKVTWLSRREVGRFTAAVIVVSVAMAVFLGGVDLLLSFILTKFVL